MRDFVEFLAALMASTAVYVAARALGLDMPAWATIHLYLLISIIQRQGRITAKGGAL